MALTVTSGLTLQDACDTISTWTRTHSVAQASAITDTDDFLENGASVAWQTKTTGTGHGMAWDKGTANIDLSATILRMRVQAKEANKYDTKANGGVRVFVSDGAFGADNWGEWYIEGSDTLPFKEKWINVVIDTTTPFDNTSATAPTMTTIRRIGISTNMITKPAKVQNINVDIIRTGRGITITGTNTVAGKGWQEIIDLDEASVLGIVRRNPNGTIDIAGELIFGDAAGTGSVDFTDNQNEQLLWAAPFSGNLDGLYKILIQGNATGTTNFQLGDVIGTGDDRQGVLGGSYKSINDRVVFDAETDTADIDSCNLYGCTFDGFGKIQLSGATTQELIGGSLIRCDEFQPNNAENLNYTVIGPSPDRGVEYTTAGVGKQINFVGGTTADQEVIRAFQVDVSATPDATVDYTTDINDVGAGDVIPFPATEAAGDYFAIGHRSKFNAVKINTSTARSGGSLIWRYWNGSAWTTFTPSTDNTNTLSTTGLQTVTLWTTPPASWAARSLVLDSGFRKEIPIFYITLEVVTTMTTNPLITQAFIADLVEHHVHHPATATETYEAMKFFGFGASGGPKWHGENSSTGSLTINPTENASPIQAEFDNTNGGSTTVNLPSVTLSVNVKDLATKTNQQNARVYIRASDGTGDLPFEDSVTITRAGTVATVAHTAHGLATGEKVKILGITNKTEDNNGVHTITVTGANAYTYVTTDSGATTYTGSITSTGVLIEGLTDASGNISVSRAFSVNQPITGVVRKASASPRYKTFDLSGNTVDKDTGLSLNVNLILDE